MHAKQFVTSNPERTMPLTSSVMRQRISNFRLYCWSKKFQMLRKNVKSLLEQLHVCIFEKIVFGVRCTLNNISLRTSPFPPHYVSVFFSQGLIFMVYLKNTEYSKYCLLKTRASGNESQFKYYANYFNLL